MTPHLGLEHTGVTQATGLPSAQCVRIVMRWFAGSRMLDRVGAVENDVGALTGGVTRAA